MKPLYISLCSLLAFPVNAELQEEILHWLYKSYGLMNLSLDIKKEQIISQSLKYGSAISPFEAFMVGFTSFVKDDKDLESPLNIATTVCRKNGISINNCGPRTLMKYLDDPLSLIALIDDADIKNQGHHIPPARGETLEQNWIFLLSVPALSDHLYWAIVPRNGRDNAYNYGFN